MNELCIYNIIYLNIISSDNEHSIYTYIFITKSLDCLSHKCIVNEWRKYVSGASADVVERRTEHAPVVWAS